jgi:hypothetical protein
MFKYINFVSAKMYKIITLHTVSYGFETWALILKEEHRLHVFENMMLRRVFGPKRVEIRVGLRKFYNEAIDNLHCSPNRIKNDQGKENKMGRLCSMKERGLENRKKGDH